MAFTEIHTITLTKHAKRQLTEKVIRSNVADMLVSVNNKSLKVSGWILDTESDIFWMQTDNGITAEYRYTYQVAIRVSYFNDSKPADKLDLARIVRTVHTRSNAPLYGRWSVTALDGEEYTPITDNDDVVGDTKDMVGYAEMSIPANWSEHFEHLYGLDSHISRVLMALEAGIMSGFNNRFHCALVGPPGCGKSDICRSMKRALGEDAVMEFDATATTAAGAIKELSEREILPRVLIVEEIEKADPKSLGFLLALCDQRGEIRKTTARATIQRDTKVLVVATVNDYELFKSLQAGALASRFANTIWFKRPSRDQLAMILRREVAKVNGDFAWIAPALDWSEKRNDTDPRSVTATCLCGREKLLDGTFQRMMEDTSPIEPQTTDTNW